MEYIQCKLLKDNKAVEVSFIPKCKAIIGKSLLISPSKYTNDYDYNCIVLEVYNDTVIKIDDDTRVWSVENNNYVLDDIQQKHNDILSRI